MSVNEASSPNLNASTVLKSVSVIVVNYNYGRFLRQCVESVQSQGYPLIEIIIVDDGSTDHSRDVIASLNKPFDPIFKNNGGQVSTVNAGFARASGEIVVILDADDYLAPGALFEYSRAMGDPEVVRCQGYMRVITEDALETKRLVPSKPPESANLAEILLKRGPGTYVTTPTSGNAWRSTFLASIMPLPENPRLGVDGLLFLAAPLLGKTVTIPLIVAYYRVHIESLSARNSRDTLSSIPNILDAYVWQCRWLKELFAEQGVLVNQHLWSDSNWRITTLKHLAARLGHTEIGPTLREHLRSVRGARTLLMRLFIALFVLTIRYLPINLAIFVTARFVNLRYMAKTQRLT